MFPAASMARTITVASAPGASFKSRSRIRTLSPGFPAKGIRYRGILTPLTSTMKPMVPATHSSLGVCHETHASPAGRSPDSPKRAPGAAGGALCAQGVFSANLWLFAFGAFLFGIFGGFAQLYRFAATDVAKPDYRSRAISLVLAGGVVAAFVGPETAKIGRNLIASTPFAGGYLLMVGICLLSAAVLMSLDTFNALLETWHLLKSPANSAHLARSIEQYQGGQVQQRDLVDVG